MSSKTKIEWTETTWNPITGCSKHSTGCKNCYAAVFAKRLKAMKNIRYSNGFDVTIHRDIFDRPLSWKTPRLVFANSMSDMFHKDVPDDVILELFEIMGQAKQHTFQILTKRSERLAKMSGRIKWTDNIWMGVSIEDDAALSRADDLRKTGAKVKFISAEPLLSSLSDLNLAGIDWLIVGGESGHKARPMEKQWAEELQKKAEESNTAFFFKQWGGWNKKKTGNLLNGVEYKEWPELAKSD